jgi:hypothetical protein
MQPAMPRSEKRERLPLERGRTGVHHLYPYTIRLTGRIGGEVEPARVKIDPGSKTVTREEDGNKGTAILRLGEFARGGRQTSEALTRRRASRHRRRNADLRDRVHTEKSARLVEEFSARDAKRLASIWPQLKAPPRDTAAVNAGIHVGRLKVGATGSFTVGKADRIKARRCKRLHHADGSGYGRRLALPSAIEIAGFRRGVCLW